MVNALQLQRFQLLQQIFQSLVLPGVLLLFSIYPEQNRPACPLDNHYQFQTASLGYSVVPKYFLYAFQSIMPRITAARAATNLFNGNAISSTTTSIFSIAIFSLSIQYLCFATQVHKGSRANTNKYSFLSISLRQYKPAVRL